MNTWVYQCSVRGEKRWRVDYVEAGRRRRKHFTDRRSADLLASQLSSGLRTAKAVWAALTENERERVILAYHDAVADGHDLCELLARAKQLPKVRSVPLSKVADEFIAGKRNGGRSERYVDVLEIVLNQFCKGRESVRVDAVALPDIESFLASKRLAYRPTLRARVSSLFRFAVRRGYRADNPCDRLESIKVTRPTPAILTTKQTVQCLEYLTLKYKTGLAWFALSALAGLRPEEAEKTKWTEINFAEGFIRVEAQTTKVRQRRIVYPRAEAMAVLQFAKRKKASLPIPPQRRRRIIRRLRDVLGFPTWPKDITRHTAASYWLADDGSAANVSKMLGNSESVLNRDYKALVTQKDAKVFWATVSEWPDGRKRK